MLDTDLDVWSLARYAISSHEYPNLSCLFGSGCRDFESVYLSGIRAASLEAQLTTKR
jgi:hypothetical protein